jgi:hypothetical protein
MLPRQPGSLARASEMLVFQPFVAGTGLARPATMLLI